MKTGNNIFLLLSLDISRMPSFGLPLKSSQVDSLKTKVLGDGDSVASETSLGKMVDGWDGITLEYSVDWPLHLFFTQEILSM